jgi:hypothetical protein
MGEDDFGNHNKSTVEEEIGFSYEPKLRTKKYPC